ncbi:energy-coupling factor ABC transporter permease [Neisseriaceae bacterium TC5R-5]|nr:energy-coupling factor ABC transporter permease [Neisseriaceae bacterium TC5R-5]
MDLPADVFSAPWLWLSNALMLLCLVLAGMRVQWRSLSLGTVHVCLLACALLLLLRLIKAGLLPGLSFHLLGAALFTLLMGPWLALLALALVMLCLNMAGLGEMQAMGLNYMVAVLLPVAWVSLLLRVVQRYLPAHFFIYVFINGFLAAGSSLLLASLAGLLLLGWQAAYSWSFLLEESLPFYFLLSWSEAFTTGLLLALLTVYRPQWVLSFDDERYLAKPAAPGEKSC